MRAIEKSLSLYLTDFIFFKTEERVISCKVNPVPDYLILSQVRSKKC